MKANSGVASAQRMLKGREAWKYADVKTYLDSNSIKHEFEYVVGDFFIYDLVLPDYGLLIEFDGTCHNTLVSMHNDFEKDNIAEENGYEIIRIKVDNNLVIPADDLAGILSQYKIL